MLAYSFKMFSIKFSKSFLCSTKNPENVSYIAREPCWYWCTYVPKCHDFKNIFCKTIVKHFGVFVSHYCYVGNEKGS
jgi:hypothetical protein